MIFTYMDLCMLFLSQVNGQRGIFPAKYIREFQVFANKDQLKQLPDVSFVSAVNDLNLNCLLQDSNVRL